MKVQDLRSKACKNNSNSGRNSNTSHLQEVCVNLRDKFLKFLLCFACLSACA